MPSMRALQPDLSRLVRLLTVLDLSLQTSTPLQARGADPAVRCSELEQELSRSHQSRGEMIRGCVEITRLEVKTMTDNKEDKYKIRAKQSILRGLESEFTIEEIIRERTRKVFREKCSEFL